MPHFVHCHIFDAYLIGIPAAWLAFIRGRVYTRHNATYHREYYPLVKFDTMVNWPLIAGRGHEPER